MNMMYKHNGLHMHNRLNDMEGSESHRGAMPGFRSGTCCSAPRREEMPLGRLSGRVTGLPSVGGVVIEFSVNGKEGSVMTDTSGFYSLEVPEFASVLILPAEVEGFTVEPQKYRINCFQIDRGNLNFHYTPTVV